MAPVRAGATFFMDFDSGGYEDRFDAGGSFAKRIPFERCGAASVFGLCGFGGVASSFFSPASRRASISLSVNGSSGTFMAETIITPGETIKLNSRDLFGEKHDTFYRAIGTCIGSWAWVDEKFFEIFQACVGPVAQCAIIYYKVPNLDARITLTDEIVLSRLPQKANGEHDHASIADWANIRKRATDLLATRRRVAHHPVHISIWGIEDEATTNILDVNLDLTAFEIYVSASERARKPDKEWKPLTLADLEEHAKAVAQVSREVTSVNVV